MKIGNDTSGIANKITLNILNKEGYAVVYINSAPFLYTGKTETLYLKNKAKT